MADFTFADGFDKLLDFLKFKEAKRKELFESDFDDFCDEFLTQKRFLISQVDHLASAMETKTGILEALLTSNDVKEDLSGFENDFDEIVARVGKLRHAERDRRIALYRIAEDRSAHDYYEIRAKY